jgi:hypothetical protein
MVARTICFGPWGEIMAYAVAHDPEREFNDCLRAELCWPEVANGLSRVLIGYAVLFLGIVLGVTLLVAAIVGFHQAFTKGLRPGIANWWELYAGLGVLKVFGLISFGIIVGGQWKCVLHVTERHGARWIMFLCIACLFLGPAFQISAGIAGWQQIGEFNKQPGKFGDLHLNDWTQRLQLIAIAIGALYPLFFVLFLRAVAICLRVTWLVWLVNVFLVFAAIVVAATMFMVYKHPLGGPPIPVVQALMLGGLWLVILILYLASIATTRVCIYSVFAKVKSPLQF